MQMLRLQDVWKMKIKNGLNSQEWRNAKKNLFKMFLKTIDWKAIQKFCFAIICGLHLDRTSSINYEKYDEKCYDQWYLSLLSNTYSC